MAVILEGSLCVEYEILPLALFCAVYFYKAVI